MKKIAVPAAAAAALVPAMLAAGAQSVPAESVPATAARPNVIVLIADDLGCGDVSAYGSQLRTPNIDRLAANGLVFRRAYAASATSSPSRYALLTGIYPWRRNVEILPGDSPLIIPTERPTLATMFRNAGYKTAAIGKWHLGLGRGNTDWNAHIAPGPNEIGFDRAFIMAATNDRVPCVYFADGFVVGRDPADPIFVDYQKNFDGEPTGAANPELLKIRPSPNHGHLGTIVNGVSRIGFMKGGNAARWRDETMAETLSAAALDFIRGNKNAPFFLYYALHQPHVPRVPNTKFAGTSGLGARGDVILEADAQIGELLDFLEKEGLRENTLIVFTSDNGPVLDDGYADDAVALAAARGYSATGGLRGGKYSLFEGGTRVPLVVCQPGTVSAGTSAVPVSQLDLFASFAALVGGAVPAEADSQNRLDVFFGKNKTAGRENFVIEAMRALAFRKGDFVYIPAHPTRSPIAWQTGIETGGAAEDALFRISDDAAQTRNLATELPEKTAEMRTEMLRITGGRM